MSGYSYLNNICERCGAPMGEHMVGGSGPYHPRPPLDSSRPVFKAITEFTDAELRDELHRRASVGKAQEP